MKTQRFFVLLFIVLLVSSVLASALGAATLPEDGLRGQETAETDEFLALVSEETGMRAAYTAESSACTFDGGYGLYLCWPESAAVLPERSPDQANRALEMLGTVGLLLVPDSTADRIMAFDPASGDLVDPNFVPADPAHLGTPKHAILSSSGTTLLVADQIEDVVQEYDLLGNYIGIFAPAGGPNTAILDNIRGIALRPNGNLLVTVGAGGNNNAVAEFDTAGNYVGNFIPIGSGGLDSPFDVYQRAGDWMVNGINSDAIHTYNLSTGAYISDLTTIHTFPQQLAEAANNNVLVANFTGTEEGIVEYTPGGTLVGIYHPSDGYRGVYELANGNFLVTTNTGVYEIDRTGTIVDTKFVGTGGQYIEYISISFPLINGSKSALDTLFVGQPLTYTISVRNWGTDATGVVMTDIIPAGTSYIINSLTCQGGSGTCAYDSPNDQITWNGDLANSEALTITYAVHTDQVNCGLPIENLAVFSNPATPFDTMLGHQATAWKVITTYDFEANNGGFTANTPPGEWAWGALVPSANSPVAAHSGSNLWATNLSGNIPVEPSTHYLTKTVNFPPGPSQLTWWDWWDGDGADNGSVSVGGTELYSQTLDQHEWLFHKLDLTGWQGQTVELSYFYNAGGTGTGGAGWYVDDVTLLNCEVIDLSGSSKDAPAIVESGDTFTYTIAIVNNSNGTATATSMVDPIPAGLTYVPGSVTGGAVYNSSQNQIEWNGDVDPLATVIITFMVEATADSGMVTNTATIVQSSAGQIEVSASTTIETSVFHIYMPVIFKP